MGKPLARRWLCAGLLAGLLLGTVLSSQCLAVKNIFDDDWVDPNPPKTPTHPAPARTPTPAPQPQPEKPVTPSPIPTPTPTPEPVKPAPEPSPAPNVPQPQTPAPMPAAAPQRRPVPAKADQQKSRKLFKEVFATELADTTPRGRRALAERLVQEAIKTTDVPCDQFVLLAGAIEAGKQAADLHPCVEAANVMGAAFDVDAFRVKVDAAMGMQFQADQAAIAIENCREGLKLVDGLTGEGDVEEAYKLLVAMRSAAPADATVREEILRRLKEIEGSRLAAQRVAAQLEKLKSAPNDPEANLLLGIEYCITQNNWPQGLPHLAKGSDAALKALALRDLAVPAAPADMAALGSDWWDEADRREGAMKNALRTRGYRWLSAALPQLKGLPKAAAEKRLAEAPYLGAAVGLLAEWKGHVGAVDEVAFCPDGRTALSTGDDGTIRQWDILDGQVIRQFTGHTGPVVRLSVAETGHLFITGSKDHSARLWDLEAGKEVHSFALGDECWSAAISPDGSKVVYASNKDQPIVCLTSNYKPVPTFKGEGQYSSAWSSNGKYLGTGGHNAFVHIFDSKTFKELGSLKQPEHVYAITFTPNGRKVLSSGPSHKVHIFDINNGKILHEFDAGETVHSIAVTPDSRCALAAGGQPNLVLWDVATGTVDGRFEGKETGVTAVAVSRDGKFALSGDKDGSVRLWKLPGN